MILRKFCMSIMTAFVLSVAIVGFYPSEIAAEGFSDIKLTEAQKEEMSKLQQEAIAKKKEIINKYVEYGVFTEEKAQKIISHMDEHYKKLEQNGFIPKWDKKHRHKKHDH